MADYFLDRGVGHMIITLGEKGCYIKDSSISCRIPAADFPAVDSTGACDAFMSALAAYLQYGYDLSLSGSDWPPTLPAFSVSRIGVIPSLISRTSLEVYLRQKETLSAEELTLVHRHHKKGLPVWEAPIFPPLYSVLRLDQTVSISLSLTIPR